MSYHESYDIDGDALRWDGLGHRRELGAHVRECRFQEVQGVAKRSKRRNHTDGA
jgi:hypothetical protein